jgi:hypothetical protein
MYIMYISLVFLPCWTAYDAATSHGHRSRTDGHRAGAPLAGHSIYSRLGIPHLMSSILHDNEVLITMLFAARDIMIQTTSPSRIGRITKGLPRTDSQMPDSVDSSSPIPVLLLPGPTTKRDRRHPQYSLAPIVSPWPTKARRGSGRQSRPVANPTMA